MTLASSIRRTIALIVFLAATAIGSRIPQLASHANGTRVPSSANLAQNLKRPDPISLRNPSAGGKVFGYFAGAMDGVGLGNYLDEYKDHTNVTFVAGSELAKLKQAQEEGIGVILTIRWQLFDENQKFRANAEEIWNPFAKSIAPYRNQITAFYLIDEPFWTAAGAMDPATSKVVYEGIQSAIRLVKKSYPEIPVYSIFAAPTVQDPQFRIPTLLDWVAMDCYTGFDNCAGWSIPQYVQRLKAKMAAHQKLLLVPPSARRSRSGITTVDLFSWADRYYEMAAKDPRIVGMTPFIWQSFPEGDDIWEGTRDLPQLKQKFISVGRALGMHGSLPTCPKPLPELKTTPKANGVPIGYIEQDAFGRGFVRGWAYDPDQPDRPLKIHVYIDGQAPNGPYGYEIVANLARPDVNKAMGIPGDHGFQFTIPPQFLNGCLHRVNVYALDATGVGVNPLLGSMVF